MSNKIIVQNSLSDLLAFTKLVPARRRKIREASPASLPIDPVTRAMDTLHPERMSLLVKDVKQETDSTKSFTLASDPERGTKRLAPFRAGQYLNLRIDVRGTVVSRNYSLSSTPKDAEAGFYRITVRKKEGGFITPYIFDSWKAGTRLTSSGPVGNFVYEPLRDRPEIVAIAGGCGITPLYSMALDSVQTSDDRRFTIIYGIRNSRDIIFRDELAELAEKNPEKIRVHYVASDPEAGWSGRTGFITSAVISEIVGPTDGKSFFLCGPQAMYLFLDKELASLSLRPRLVRRELFGEADDPSRLPGYPKANLGMKCTLIVHMADETLRIPASGAETVLVALERAGLAPPSLCRSGECGWCRSKLVSGKVYVTPTGDGRRIADKKYGWFHPCSSYPLSDLEIRVPRSTF